MKELFNEINSLMEYIEGQKNYEVNCIHLNIQEDGIEVESMCRNEYGTYWGNEDTQFIPWGKLSWEAIIYLIANDNEVGILIIHKED
jgi:hypothetical protein